MLSVLYGMIGGCIAACLASKLIAYNFIKKLDDIERQYREELLKISKAAINGLKRGEKG